MSRGRTGELSPLTCCEPAASVLRALGVRHIARKLKLTPGAVSQWARVGYGEGAIPKKHKAAVVQMLRDGGAAHLIERVSEMAGGRASRQKGDRFEREIVKALLDKGVTARRVPLSGAVEGFPGDIELEHRGVKLLGQCKISADGSGYSKILALISEHNVVNITDADGFRTVAMPFSEFVRFLEGGERAIRVGNPVHGIKITTARKALAGHHALFFRKDRDTPNVIIPRAVYDFFNR
jgi:hypothetical protein